MSLATKGSVFSLGNAIKHLSQITVLLLTLSQSIKKRRIYKSQI